MGRFWTEIAGFSKRLIQKREAVAGMSVYLEDITSEESFLVEKALRMKTIPIQRTHCLCRILCQLRVAFAAQGPHCGAIDTAVYMRFQLTIFWLLYPFRSLLCSKSYPKYYPNSIARPVSGARLVSNCMRECFVLLTCSP